MRRRCGELLHMGCDEPLHKRYDEPLFGVRRNPSAVAQHAVPRGLRFDITRIE